MSPHGFVDLPIGDGKTKRLPLAQAAELGRLMQEHADEGRSTWHMAECGCCACFHPGGATDRGYVIGPDGESDYHEGHA